MSLSDLDRTRSGTTSGAGGGVGSAPWSLRSSSPSSANSSSVCFFRFLASMWRLTSAPVASATAAGPVERRMTIFRLLVDAEEEEEEEESGASIRRRPQVGRAIAGCFLRPRISEEEEDNTKDDESE